MVCSETLKKCLPDVFDILCSDKTQNYAENPASLEQFHRVIWKAGFWASPQSGSKLFSFFDYRFLLLFFCMRHYLLKVYHSMLFTIFTESLHHHHHLISEQKEIYTIPFNLIPILPSSQPMATADFTFCFCGFACSQKTGFFCDTISHPTVWKKRKMG